MAISSVSSAASDTQLAAPSGSRQGLVITNTDANVLYVALDSSAASTSNYSFRLSQNESYFSEGEECYRGEVRGIWAADGAGVALVTTWEG